MRKLLGTNANFNFYARLLGFTDNQVSQIIPQNRGYLIQILKELTCALQTRNFQGLLSPLLLSRRKNCTSVASSDPCTTSYEKGKKTGRWGCKQRRHR